MLVLESKGLLKKLKLPKELIAPLTNANEEQVTFFDNKKYLEDFKTTKAAACFVKPELAKHAPEGTICILNKNKILFLIIAKE